MAALFGHVWDTGDLGRNMRGGSGRLPETLGANLGDSIRLGARVEEVALDGAGVSVRFTGEGGSDEVKARAAVIAVPAPLIPPLLRDMPPETADALGRVTFGPMVVLSILTGETERMPWDDLYSILTPDKSFNMFFNHANFMRSGDASKQGSVIMVYAGGDRARALLDLDEDAIRDRFLDDLDDLYPQVRGHHRRDDGEEVGARRPVCGARPLAGPGGPRAGRRQPPLLRRRLGQRVRLHGDGRAHGGRRRPGGPSRPERG